MKIYILEFHYFDLSYNKQIHIEIIAESKYQLIKQFLIETKYICFDTQKEKWNKYKNDIKVLNVPIVTYLND